MDSVAVSSCTDKQLDEIGIKTFGDKIALRGFAIEKGSNQLDQDARKRPYKIYPKSSITNL